MTTTDRFEHETVLEGVSSSTLAGYLAALGLFRLVAEQADPAARLSWRGSVPVLRSSLDGDAVAAFLLDDYVPTPLVAPWNGSSFGGFAVDAADRHADAIEAVLRTTTERWAGFREVMSTTRSVVRSQAWDVAMSLKDKQAGKAAAVRLLRNALPDAAVRFLDASVALTTDAPRYPPVLGTGGNLGRLDLVVTAWERLLFCLGETAVRRGDGDRTETCRAALLGGEVQLHRGSIAQFDAMGSGGPNAGRSGEGVPLTNPWSFVLLVEGALLLAAAASRRLGSDRSSAVAPFTVGATRAGFASVAAEESGGEFWAPIWTQPASLGELESLLAEGRATWAGRQARTGIDFARAVRTLGIDRGIDSFVRFGFPVRNGQMRIAVPLGGHRPDDSSVVRLTAEYDQWVGRFQGVASGVSSLASHGRRLDLAVFRVAERPSPGSLQALLGVLVHAERAAHRSGKDGERGLPPVPFFDPLVWLEHLDDGSVEFRLALALNAGCHSMHDAPAGWMACLAEAFRPVTVAHRTAGTSPRWARRSPIAGVGHRSIVDVLCDVAVLRARTARVRPNEATVAFVGCRPQFGGPVRLPLRDVEALAVGAVDARRLAGWIDALSLMGDIESSSLKPEPGVIAEPAPLLRLIAPFFFTSSRALSITTPAGERGTFRPSVPVEWPSLLSAGRGTAVARQVPSRLAIAGGGHQLGRGVGALVNPTVDECRRALAAALVPLARHDTARLVGATGTQRSAKTTTEPDYEEE